MWGGLNRRRRKGTVLCWAEVENVAARLFYVGRGFYYRSFIGRAFIRPPLASPSERLSIYFVI
jgi:hypothetical protein